MSRSSLIQKNDRQRCINHLKKVMYSKNGIDYTDYYNLAVQEKYANFVLYVKKLNDRQKEWALFHRNKLLVRAQNTNNIRKAAFRRLKESILERLKAFVLSTAAVGIFTNRFSKLLHP